MGAVLAPGGKTPGKGNSICHYYNDYNKYGVLTEHRKLMESYGNLASCFYWFLQNNIGY